MTKKMKKKRWNRRPRYNYHERHKTKLTNSHALRRLYMNRHNLKRMALVRDSHKCVRCGRQYDLQMHHIIPKYAGGKNEIGNVEILCKKCHRQDHKGEHGYA